MTILTDITEELDGLAQSTTDKTPGALELCNHDQILSIPWRELRRAQRLEALRKEVARALLSTTQLKDSQV